MFLQELIRACQHLNWTMTQYKLNKNQEMVTNRLAKHPRWYLINFWRWGHKGDFKINTCDAIMEIKIVVLHLLRCYKILSYYNSNELSIMVGQVAYVYVKIRGKIFNVVLFLVISAEESCSDVRTTRETWIFWNLWFCLTIRVFRSKGSLEIGRVSQSVSHKVRNY